MYYLGITPRGPLYVEKLTKLPSFDITKDIGRLIFVQNDQPYIGTIDGWITITLQDKSVKEKHIDFGLNIGQVNAKSIPILYNYKSITLNDLADIYNDNFDKIKSGIYFDPNCIGAKSIDFTLYSGVTGNLIYINDLKTLFSAAGLPKTIYECLDILNSKTGKDILIGQDLVSGNMKYNKTMSISDVLFKIVEKQNYEQLTADDIPCRYTSYVPYLTSHCVDGTVQQAIENAESYIHGHRLIDHMDVQSDYGKCHQYLGTYGNSEDNCCSGPCMPLKFKYIYADEIKMQVPRYSEIPGAKGDMSIQTFLGVFVDFILSKIGI